MRLSHIHQFKVTMSKSFLSKSLTPPKPERTFSKFRLKPQANNPLPFLKTLNKPSIREDMFSLPPSVYATTFLVLIPLFGFLYSTLPNMQFNHENMGFLEALYFSTITVTTTGFGDITPTNTFTRAFVMVESIIGVVSAGLFLNAVTYQREENMSKLIDAYEARKEISYAFARLHSHDSLITLNMNTYLNRVNQLLGIEDAQTPVATSDSEGKANLDQSQNTPSSPDAKVSEQLIGIHEPIPQTLEFSNLQHLFDASSRLTDDPHKPQIWYYYQALEDLLTSIENLVRETETYRWEALESLCIQYLSDIKSFDSSSYILAEPNFEKQLADIQAQRQKDMLLIGEYPIDKTVELSNENSLNPYIILFMGIETTIQFIQDFQLEYQNIMQSI